MSYQETLQRYAEEKAKLPAIALWMRPFLVPNFDIQDVYQKLTTPREIISSLAGDFPALLWNVLRERSYLDGPQLWLEIEQTKSGVFNPIERLLCYREAPPSLLSWAFGAGYQRSVLRHPACTSELFPSLALELSSSGGPYREEQHPTQNIEELYKALNPGTRASDLEAMLKRTSSTEMLCAIAENPSADIRVLSLLWNKDEACHAMLARHPKTAPFLLQEFFRDPKLRPHLVQNPALPDGFVSRLADYFIDEGGAESRQCLVCLALNPGLCAESVDALVPVARSLKDPGVAFALLLQDRTTFDAGASLSKLDAHLRSFVKMRLAVSDAQEHRWRCQQPPSSWG